MIEAPDGRFYMLIEEFHKQFYQTTICHYRKNYKQKTIGDTHSVDGHGICQIDIGEDVDDVVTFILT